eukprot:CAMPEP_0170096594 /NCGR_PEP_ID=MMETSP0019_2-20121128/28692_1 /TAXON_ID=98059 /ORGANISM="Dinobryon sp., Strain UTEXLB2267" /LENGTH=801 /DNA_ID=CAMNT_0010318641 /DNA_START=556 /DNA_END=2961 /DNA_ORIENTATION=-
MKNKERRDSFSRTEYQCALYLSFLSVGIVVGFLIDFLTEARPWQNANEIDLVGIVLLQMIITVFVTVLPGRLIRMDAMISLELLSMKQLFVRYISHEIRSPLNVVHAGVDMLRDELKSNSLKESNMCGIRDLLDDIFAASESAICVLNDLLNYEHLDAGTFTLKLNWKPLARLFEGKLLWTEVLAKDKEIHLKFNDETVCTEVGVQRFLHQAIVESGSQFDSWGEWMEGGLMSSGTSLFPFIQCDLPVIREIINLAPLADACLHMDVEKIDQVMRNIISHAIKNTPTNGTVEINLKCTPVSTTSRGKIISKALKNVVGMLEVEVVDSGGGFDDADLQKVFGELSQFDINDLRGGGGTGLGLWISRKVINLHQGRMGIRSSGKGLGSTLFFELPLFPAAMMNASLTSTNPVSGLDVESRATMFFAEQRSSRALIAVEQPPTVPIPPTSLTDRILDNNNTGVSGFADLAALEMEEADEPTEYCNTHREERDSNNGDGNSLHNISENHDGGRLLRSDVEEGLDALPFRALRNSFGMLRSSFDFMDLRRSFMSAGEASPRVAPYSAHSGTDDDIQKIINATSLRFKSRPTSSKDKTSATNDNNTSSNAHNNCHLSPSATVKDIKAHFLATSADSSVSTFNANDMPHSSASSMTQHLYSASGGQQQKHPMRVTPMRFLIVDDSLLNRKIVRRILEADSDRFPNCYIKEADDGVTALEMVKSEASNGINFDFILIDYIMLKMHGPEAVEILRTSLNYRGVIIGITGNALPADIAKLISSGVNEVVLKPLTKAKLIDALLRNCETLRH